MSYSDNDYKNRHPPLLITENVIVCTLEHSATAYFEIRLIRVRNQKWGVTKIILATLVNFQLYSFLL